MNILSAAGNASRGALGLWLQALRVPLTAYEAVARRGDADAGWPPAVAFDTFEASVREVVGRLLRDEQLVAQAHLIRVKVGQIRKAADLEAAAEGKRAEARDDLDVRLEDNAVRRARVRDAAEERKARLQAEHEQRELEIEREAAERRQRGRRADQAVEQGLQRTERSDRAHRVQRRTETAEAGRKALKAQQDLTQLDSTIAASKATRRSAR
jgi:hypothetical protein